MTKPVLIPVTLTPISIDTQLTTLGWSAPKASTLQRIRAYAREFRPL